jgi:hypothetical protein
MNINRNFSSSPKTETSIFEQADYFKGEETVAVAESVAPSKDVMPWFDTSDSLGAFQAVVPKDLENLPQGVSTYGIFEYVSYLDTLFTESWFACAQMGSMGLMGGLLISSLATRMVFVPLAIYSQTVGMKMKLLAPDTDLH